MDEQERLRVDPWFRVKGHKRVFAIGDCCATDEDKLATTAAEHGMRVARIIFTLIQVCAAASKQSHALTSTCDWLFSATRQQQETRRFKSEHWQS